MRRPLFAPFCLMLIALLGGCGRDDPQEALDAAVQELQDNLEDKRTSAVLEQLHADFRAQDDLDREWAKRTMTLLFLQHQNVKVIALSQRNQLDPIYPSKAATEAEVALTGAERLIPDSARHYSVRLEWWLEDNEWKLARLQWR
ncbi:hypothetical protein JQX08_10345 [Pseudomonas sp. UL073]|uniref:Nuclear transport factor 2 family protein n=1 Tax=Zestomonas insulae TaxID=2809017 RepID=A0ABS2IDI9_9GAMM|nr:hypothetical protein [Pseudomonas insulae]MBM7061105.1 hypothetical protein [Pseudomonas insulae]